MTVAAERQPYPGLRSFARDEADLFFGRENAVAESIKRLAATRFLMLAGPSGTGKSSLLKAGLIPALEDGRLEQAGPNWRVADLRPGIRPLTSLAEALLRAAAAPEADEAPGTDAIEALRAELEQSPGALIDWLQADNLPERTNLLLLVDPLEELFHAEISRDEAEAFVALLLASVALPPDEAPICIAAAMRSEYLAGAASFAGLSEVIAKSLYAPPSLNSEQLRQAIVRPAKVCGFKIEPPLVDALLEDASSPIAPPDEDPGEALDRAVQAADRLPLLQHALSQLWLTAAQRKGKRVLKLDDYEKLGRLRDALATHVQGVLEALLPEHRDVAPIVFRAMSRGASLADAVGRPAPYGELEAIAHGDSSAVREIIETFRAPDNGFLLPPRPQPLRVDTPVEITHECLIRQWPTFHRWLKAEAHAAATWQRLADRAESHERGEAELLSGFPLASIADWWEREQPTPSWAERYSGDFAQTRSFLEKSQRAQAALDRAATERQGRGMRNKLLAFAAVVTIGIIAPLGVFAGYAAIRSNEAAERARIEAAAADDARQATAAAEQLAGAEQRRAVEAEEQAQADRQLAEEAQASAEEAEQRAVAAREQADELAALAETERARAETERLRALEAIEAATRAGTERDQADEERRLALVARDAAERAAQEATSERELAELARQQAANQKELAETAREQAEDAERAALDRAAAAEAAREAAEEAREQALAAAQEAEALADKERLHALAAIDQVRAAEEELERVNEELATAIATAEAALAEKELADQARLRALRAQSQAIDPLIEPDGSRTE